MIVFLTLCKGWRVFSGKLSQHILIWKLKFLEIFLQGLRQQAFKLRICSTLDLKQKALEDIHFAQKTFLIAIQVLWNCDSSFITQLASQVVLTPRGLTGLNFHWSALNVVHLFTICWLPTQLPCLAYQCSPSPTHYFAGNQLSDSLWILRDAFPFFFFFNNLNSFPLCFLFLKVLQVVLERLLFPWHFPM